MILRKDAVKPGVYAKGDTFYKITADELDEVQQSIGQLKTLGYRFPIFMEHPGLADRKGFPIPESNKELLESVESDPYFCGWVPQGEIGSDGTLHLSLDVEDSLGNKLKKTGTFISPQFGPYTDGDKSLGRCLHHVAITRKPVNKKQTADFIPTVTMSLADVEEPMTFSLDEFVTMSNDAHDELGKFTTKGGGKGKAKTLSEKILKGKLPENMTAGEINKALDALDEHHSKLVDEMIETGRGHERPSDYRDKDDDLSMRLKESEDVRSGISIEKHLRCGPNPPRRLDKSFGPRRKMSQENSDIPPDTKSDSDSTPDNSTETVTMSNDAHDEQGKFTTKGSGKGKKKSFIDSEGKEVPPPPTSLPEDGDTEYLGFKLKWENTVQRGHKTNAGNLASIGLGTSRKDTSVTLTDESGYERNYKTLREAIKKIHDYHGVKQMSQENSENPLDTKSNSDSTPDNSTETVTMAMNDPLTAAQSTPSTSNGVNQDGTGTIDELSQKLIQALQPLGIAIDINSPLMKNPKALAQLLSSVSSLASQCSGDSPGNNDGIIPQEQSTVIAMADDEKKTPETPANPAQNNDQIVRMSSIIEGQEKQIGKLAAFVTNERKAKYAGRIKGLVDSGRITPATATKLSELAGTYQFSANDPDQKGDLDTRLEIYEELPVGACLSDADKIKQFSIQEHQPNNNPFFTAEEITEDRLAQLEKEYPSAVN